VSRYAQYTQVPVGRSQEAIRKLVIDAGATGWALGEDGGRAVVSFRLEGRLLRFRLEIPESDPKEERRRWRALLLAIKAKITIANEQIESFDEIFLNNIVLPNNATVGDMVVPQLQAMLESGQLGTLKLLPASTR
jgi:hypothetical protein